MEGDATPDCGGGAAAAYWARRPQPLIGGKVDEKRRTSFDEKAEQYDAIRPTYPDALVRAVIARTGARSVVEVGAGTGQATAVFARLGCGVVALEPGPRIAAILRRRVAGFPHVRVETTTFEAWTEEPRRYDLLLAAQSFHWVDPDVRYAKAARVARHLAILSNEVAHVDPAVRAAFDDAYTTWTGGGDGNERARHAVEIARRTGTEEIDRSGLFGPVHVEEVPWEATYGTAEYVALIDTYSDHAVLEEPVRRGLYAAIASAIDRHGGRLVVRYVAMAFVAMAK